MEVIVNLYKNFWLNLQTGQLSQTGVWSYLLLVVVVAIEGPLATLLAAAAAAGGYLRVNVVFIAAALGNLLADLGWYLLGYLGKVEWVLRVARRFGLRQRQLEQIQRALADHAPKLLILAKLTAAFTIPTLIVAGLSKVPLKRWLPGYVLAEALWTGCLVLIGYHATAAITRVEKGVQNWGIAAGAIFVVFAILMLRRVMQHGELQTLFDSEDRGS